jgi:thiol:disulfide interchange protein
MPTIAITSVLALIVVGAALWLLNAYIPLAGNMKTIVNVVLVLIVVGIVLWLINTYVPMAGSIKTILNIVVVIATCVGVLQAVGLWGDVVGLGNEAMSSIRNHTSGTADHPASADVHPRPATAVVRQEEYQLPDGSRMRPAEVSERETVPASKDERAG